MKQCMNEIIKPLTELVNLSFNLGTFPSKLKLSKIVPIFKKGDHTDKNNYRPISILPTFSKAYENYSTLDL